MPAASAPPLPEPAPPPFAAFDGLSRPRSELRERIAAACRRPEPDCLPPLLDAARLDAAASSRVTQTARQLVDHIRALGRARGVSGVIQEYGLSTEEGVALMCLAEALLRIPDTGTRDALIRDKIARGNWRAHLGPERTLFVNATTWGLMVTGRLTAAHPQDGLAEALTHLLARGGEPVIRAGVDIAMRMMGEQFVAGQTIDEALVNSRRLEKRGFTYSYDMLGEAAATAEDARRYLAAYRRAITAIGKAAAGRGPIGGPGISIKLSALHPRYRRSQIDRVDAELLPRLKELALLAKSFDIGLNVDAEEAERLDLSLDLFEALCLDPDLAGWDGLGFVVQAYGKRCPFVIDWLVDLARRSHHRLMVRLVKGAYWDSEIKQAQLEGLDGYPVYTRKVYSDVSYLACARRLLAAPAEIYPQFATHNAQTVAAVHEMAGADFRPGRYEFQCLHGMGEPLYSGVVGKGQLDRPCRIYAPVGTHGTLLAYLVRRLLENGANSSFVNRIGDPRVSVDDLVADPVAQAAAIAPLGAPHPHIGLPVDMFEDRRNSTGLDLADDNEIARLAAALRQTASAPNSARPVLAMAEPSAGAAAPVVNPANHEDLVGTTHFAGIDLVAPAFAAAKSDWAPPAARARLLRDVADRLEEAMPELLGLMIREAGKSAGNAVAEVREAVDFLRYYANAAAALDEIAAPLGTVVCISPWNFPLSIFTGQIAAALGAGNAVIAKPAEETTLTAAAMVAIFHAAGVPRAALQFLPGAGDLGAALVGHEQVAGVVFTGSMEVARLIQRQLATRLSPNGSPIPLIAETGGINAMIVDSSALTEQVIADVLTSAFDSAGQRCSALRLLCLQEDIADRTIAMLKLAMAELRIGDPDRLATDVGPVITAEAAARILSHIEAMRGAGHPVTQVPLDATAARGTFVPPTLIELDRIDQLQQEVFGPVLHIVRYRRGQLDNTVSAINELGYGLTFGLHTRLDATIERVTGRISAGNIYVNRNIIGAVVGVQPFGGHGLSGTGPKAGGPLYLRRLLSRRPASQPWAGASPDAAFRAWLGRHGGDPAVQHYEALCRQAPRQGASVLPGPVGELNSYRLLPRGEVLVLPLTHAGLFAGLSAAVATGNRAAVELGTLDPAPLDDLPPLIAARVRRVVGWTATAGVDTVLVEGEAGRLSEIGAKVAQFTGPIVPVEAVFDVDPDMLVREVSVSINTAAAGGNASLLALKEA